MHCSGFIPMNMTQIYMKATDQKKKKNGIISKASSIPDMHEDLALGLRTHMIKPYMDMCMCYSVLENHS